MFLFFSLIDIIWTRCRSTSDFSFYHFVESGDLKKGKKNEKDISDFFIIL